jgi:thiol-disulfide isomerase/thioredoxin
MKKIIKTAGFLLLCFATFGCNTQAQDGFVVKVKVSNPNNRTMLLAYSNGDGYVMDTSYTMEKGYRVYKGNLKNIAMASFTVRTPNSMIISGNGIIPGPQLSFVARNGATITVNGDAEKIHMATVTSDDTETMAYEAFRDKSKVWSDELFMMDKKRYANTSGNGDGPPKDIDPAKRNELNELQGKWAREFVKKNPATYAAIEVFATYALEMSDADQAKQFAALPSTYKNTELGKVIQDKISGSTETAVGNAAISFSQKGFNGEPVDLNALKGKVVLIDFWGSWCAPCRASFPHLKELYAKNKNRGFEIIGIAKENGNMESQQKAWSEAVKKDQISWLNILNNDEQDNIVRKYGVVQFPTKILVDRNGVIQGRYTGDGDDKALEQKLNELLQGNGNAQAVTSGRAMPVIVTDKVTPGSGFGRTSASGAAKPAKAAAKADSVVISGKAEPGVKFERSTPVQPAKKN